MSRPDWKASTVEALRAGDTLLADDGTAVVVRAKVWGGSLGIAAWRVTVDGRVTPLWYRIRAQVQRQVATGTPPASHFLEGLEAPRRPGHDDPAWRNRREALLLARAHIATRRVRAGAKPR